MTSKVVVSAHCADTKQVRVGISADNEAEGCTIQNGETKEFYVYDSRILTVREEEK